MEEAQIRAQSSSLMGNPGNLIAITFLYKWPVKPCHSLCRSLLRFILYLNEDCYFSHTSAEGWVSLLQLPTTCLWVEVFVEVLFFASHSPLKSPILTDLQIG